MNEVDGVNQSMCAHKICAVYSLSWGCDFWAAVKPAAASLIDQSGL